MTVYAHNTYSSNAYKAGEVLCVLGHSPLFPHFNEEAQPDHTPLDGGRSGFSRDSLLREFKK